MYSGYPVIAMGQLKRLHWGRPGMFGKLTVTVIALSILQGDTPGTSGFYLIIFFGGVGWDFLQSQFQKSKEESLEKMPYMNSDQIVVGKGKDS